jgi:hypothetical protein
MTVDQNLKDVIYDHYDQIAIFRQKTGYRIKIFSSYLRRKAEADPHKNPYTLIRKDLKRNEQNIN